MQQPQQPRQPQVQPQQSHQQQPQPQQSRPQPSYQQQPRQTSGLRPNDYATSKNVSGVDYENIFYMVEMFNNAGTTVYDHGDLVDQINASFDKAFIEFYEKINHACKTHGNSNTTQLTFTIPDIMVRKLRNNGNNESSFEYYILNALRASTVETMLKQMDMTIDRTPFGVVTVFGNTNYCDIAIKIDGNINSIFDQLNRFIDILKREYEEKKELLIKEKLYEDIAAIREDISAIQKQLNNLDKETISSMRCMLLDIHKKLSFGDKAK